MISITPEPGTSRSLFIISILDRLIQASLEAALPAVGDVVSRRLKYIISSGTRTGRRYYLKGIAYRASAPGEPPANRTGRLLRSVGYRASGSHTLQVGEDAFYARWLEEGTRKMAPRPHVRVAVEQTQTEVYELIASYIREAHR